METIACPHCGAANARGSAFCDSCGKALPGAAPSSPRVVSGSAIASTSAGVKLQSDELHKQVRKAAGALMAVAIIQTVFTVIIYFVMSGAARLNPNANVGVTVGIVGFIALIFWGLYFWARTNPFPAAIVGLVIYISLWVLDAVVWMVQMSNSGSAPAGAGPFNGIILKIIIIVVLIKAIQAGAQHRRILREQSAFPA